MAWMPPTRAAEAKSMLREMGVDAVFVDKSVLRDTGATRLLVTHEGAVRATGDAIPHKPENVPQLSSRDYLNALEMNARSVDPAATLVDIPELDAPAFIAQLDTNIKNARKETAVTLAKEKAVQKAAAPEGSTKVAAPTPMEETATKTFKAIDEQTKKYDTVINSVKALTGCILGGS